MSIKLMVLAIIYLVREVLVRSNTGAPSDVPMGPSDPDCGKVIHGNFTLTANLDVKLGKMD